MARSKNKITIELFPKTRERMLSLGRKGESYDDYINRAIDALEYKEKVERAGKILGKV